MIELIIVIIVLSILSLWLGFSLQPSNVNLAAQADQLVSDLRYTQSLAMTKNQRYRWVVTSSNSYQILNSAGTAMIFATGGSILTLAAGITFGTLGNLPNQLIVFDGHGIPYTSTGSSGTALTSTATIPLIANGQTLTVAITPQTGMVVRQ